MLVESTGLLSAFFFEESEDERKSIRLPSTGNISLGLSNARYSATRRPGDVVSSTQKTLSTYLILIKVVIKS